MDEKQLSIDIVGLAGAYSYALDCIEAEMVSETQWLHECGHCVSLTISASIQSNA